MGVSMNTQGPFGVAIQGEVSGRLGQPIQVDDVELLFGAYSPLDPIHSHPARPARRHRNLRDKASSSRTRAPSASMNTSGGGSGKTCFRPRPRSQRCGGPPSSMDQIVFLFEFGGTWFFDMEDKSELRYEGPGTFTSGNDFFSCSRDPTLHDDGRVCRPLLLGLPPRDPPGFLQRHRPGHRHALACLVPRRGGHHALADQQLRRRAEANGSCPAVGLPEFSPGGHFVHTCSWVRDSTTSSTTATSCP